MKDIKSPSNYKFINISLLILTVFLSVLSSILLILESWYTGNILDSLTSMNGEIWSQISFIAGVIIANYIVVTIRTYISSKMTETYTYNVRHAVARKFHLMTYSSIEKLNTGDILSTTLANITQMSNFWRSLPWQISGIISSILAITLCLLISWKLTVICVFSIPIMILVGALASSPLERRSYEAKTKRSIANGELADILRNTSTIKAYTLEDIKVNQFTNVLRTAEEAATKEAGALAISSAISKFSGSIPMMTIIVGGSYFIFNGDISVGLFFVFANIFLNIQQLQSIIEVMSSYRSYKGSRAGIDEILALPEENLLEGTTPDRDGEKSVDFRHVSFEYDINQPVIKDLTLAINQREYIAFVGQSGSGKSTLLKLLMALYRPTSGDIWVNGLSTQQYANSAREQIGVVTQSNYLFPMTIRENILIGKPNATEEEIIQACKDADIYDFIKSLPDGLDTDVGELGDRLSGGQRQRICIARAFIKKAPILVLDEPTASLDLVTEKQILNTLYKFKESRTIIIFTHRDSALQDVDRIYGIDDGCIVQADAIRDGFA